LESSKTNNIPWLSSIEVRYIKPVCLSYSLSAISMFKVLIKVSVSFLNKDSSPSFLNCTSACSILLGFSLQESVTTPKNKLLATIKGSDLNFILSVFGRLKFKHKVKSYQDKRNA